MANPWFRVYTELLSDRKLARAAARANVSKCEMIGAWIGLLCLVNESPVRGALHVTFQERYSNADVTAELALPETTWVKIRAALEGMGMIEEKEGAIYITNWEKRQYLSDISTARVQKHRQKQDGNVSETLHERFGNAPDTDTDTESIAPKGAPAPIQPAQALERGIMADVIVKNPGALEALKRFEAKRNGSADLSWVAEHLRPLAAAFCQASDIIPVKSDRKFWYKALDDQWERGLRPEFVTKAIYAMRHDGLTVKTPASVTAIAVDLQAKARAAQDEDLGEVYE